MKKIFFLQAAAALGIFLSAGCGNAGEKVFGVNDLVDRVTADKDGWKDKEVKVSGYVMHMSRSEGASGYILNMIDRRSDESERYVNCKVPQGEPPEAITTQTVEVRGRIGTVTTQNYLNQKRVTLESCAIKK